MEINRERSSPDENVPMARAWVLAMAAMVGSGRGLRRHRQCSLLKCRHERTEIDAYRFRLLVTDALAACQDPVSSTWRSHGTYTVGKSHDVSPHENLNLCFCLLGRVTSILKPRVDTI